MRFLSLVVLMPACGFSIGASTGQDTDAGTTDAIVDGAITADDTDGDGIPNASDNCPAIANTNQRNWDGDPHGDACDGCPHLFSPSDPDADGDGVGDACDPRPATPGDARLLWTGFYEASEINAWVGTGTWAVTNGKLVQSMLTGGSITAVAATGAVYVMTAYDVDTNNANIDAEIGTCSGVTTAPMQHYCCDVIRHADTTRNVESWAQWPGQSLSISQPGFPGSFGPGVHITLAHRLELNARNCIAVEGGNATAAVNTQTSATVVGAVTLYMKQATGEYHYLFVSTVGP